MARRGEKRGRDPTVGRTRLHTGEKLAPSGLRNRNTLGDFTTTHLWAVDMKLALIKWLKAVRGRGGRRPQDQFADEGEERGRTTDAGKRRAVLDP